MNWVTGPILEMSSYVAKKVIQYLIRAGKQITKSKVLIMGTTFKENVYDIRNSKVSDLVKELYSFSVKVHITDPYADSDELEAEYGYRLTENLENDYDCIIVAVNHRQYVDLTEDYFLSISSENGILFDIKSIYINKINKLRYWCL